MNNSIKSKLFNTILNFISSALLLTNAWVFLFNYILNFLNRRFPSLPATNFVIPGAAPEPFEIPLYLTLSAVFVSIVYLIYINQRYLIKIENSLIAFSQKFNLILKSIFCLSLFFIFIQSLGGYPMKNEVYPYAQPVSRDIVNLIFALYIAVIIFIGLQLSILKIVFKKNQRVFIKFVYIFFVVLIAVLIFEPRFPISWHDYSYFFGPILEISHGKTIYTQVQSQYGFLSVLVLTFLYKLHLISLSWLPVLVWLFYVIQYFLCFYLIYVLSQSLLLGIIGLFSIMNLNVFSASACCLSLGSIQAGAFRWLPIIFLIFLFYKLKKIDSYLFIFILSLLSFWIIDVGMAILMAYSFSLLLLALVKIIDFKRLIKDYLLLGLTIVGIFFIINFVHLLFGYQLINVLAIFTKMQEYSRAGFGMLPMTSKSYFWFTLLIYFSSLVYFFQRKQYTLLDQILLFSANLTLFASVYFVGRSHQLNLFNLAPISIITWFIFWSIIFPKIKLPLIRIIFLLTIFIFFVFFPIYFRRDSAVINGKTHLDYFKKGHIFQPEMDQLIEEKYQSEKKLINENFKEKNVLIISSDDTYLLYLTNKASLLNINPLINILTQNDIKFGLEKAYQICPKKIAVDCNSLGTCLFYWKLNYYIYPYQVILDKISQHCRLQYKLQHCTNQLCIAVAD